jgi:hypothetical protein
MTPTAVLESSSRHLGALAPARPSEAPQHALPTGGGQTRLAGSQAAVQPLGAGVVGAGRPPAPGSEVARGVGVSLPVTGAARVTP